MTIPRLQIALAVAASNVVFLSMSQVAAMDRPPEPLLVRLVDAIGSFATGFEAECDAPVYFIEQRTLPHAPPPLGLSIEGSIPQCSAPVDSDLPFLLPPPCSAPVDFVLPTPLPPPCSAPIDSVQLALLPTQETRTPLKSPAIAFEIPTGCSPPRQISFGKTFSLARSVFSVDGLNLKLPSCGIDPEFAQMTAALMVYSGLLDRSLDQRLPQWRPQLAYLIANPKNKINPDTVFQLMLSGCEGIDDFSSITVALNWARRFESGKFYGEVSYAAARHLFETGKYTESALMCLTVKASCPALAVQAIILKALSETYSGDMTKAHQTLAEAKNDYADSPEMPEVHYIEAWLALQEMRIDEAKSILKRIVHNSPGSPAAVKAKQTLETLEISQ